MLDLNDMLYFAEVAERGGFAAAGRALGIPKSRLSRRVAELEAQLGVRLLQRTTRSLSLTEVGQAYLRHCQALREAAQAAQDTVEQVRSEPRGTVRVTCPVTLAQSVLGDLLPQYLARHPAVRLEVQVSNRAVNPVEEGVDVALRVRNSVDDSASLVVKRLGEGRVLLVASPAQLARQGQPQTLQDLARMDTLAMSAPEGRSSLCLQGPGAGRRRCSSARAWWPMTCWCCSMRRWPAPGCAGCRTICACPISPPGGWCACCRTGHRRRASCMRCLPRAGGWLRRYAAFWTFWARSCRRGCGFDMYFFDKQTRIYSFGF